MLLKDIRQHVTDKLEEITVLRKFREQSGVLSIVENNTSNNRRLCDNLNKIELTSIPINNTWIFENEFGQQAFPNNEELNNQKNAFTSAGKKVEKTIIHYNSNKLYLFMIEMKRTISPKKMHTEVIGKFENSLSTVSIFLAAHTIIPTFDNTELYPVGICCFNHYEEDSQPSHSKRPQRTEGRVREQYAQGKRLIPLLMEPIGLNRTISPVFFFENPSQNPVTNNFSIDLEGIIQQL